MMENQLLNLRLAVKELERNSKKCEKEENVEKLKCKKAIQKGNIDVAKIHCENAIRKKNESLNYLRMAARTDAVASRVQSAKTSKEVAKTMQSVSKSMESALKSKNLEKISQIMDKFEKQTEDLDVHSSVMESTMSSATAVSTPTSEVDKLMHQIAEEAGLELNMELPETSSAKPTSVATEEQAQADELSKRLAALRS